MSIVITDISPRVHYRAVAGETVYQIPFEWIDPDDIVVYVNEILMTQQSPPTSAFTYSLTPNPDQVSPAAEVAGGYMTFGPPGRQGGDEVIIFRNMPIERVQDFPTSGVFPVATLNDSFDKLTSMVQQTEVNVERRALRMADNDFLDTINPIPKRYQRAGKLLGFDAEGHPVAVNAGTGGSGGGDGSDASHWTGPDAPPLPWEDGDLWWESDTGILYIFYDDGTSGQWVQAAGGSGSEVGRLQDTFIVEEYGASAIDGIDDSSAIQAAIDACEANGGGTVLFTKGEYCIASGLVVDSSNVYLKGLGFQWFDNPNAGGPTRWTQNGGTVIRWIGATGSGAMLTFTAPVTGPVINGVGYEGLILDCDAKAGFGLKVLSVRAGNFPHVVVGDAYDYNVHVGVVPDTAWTSGSPRDCQHNHFGRMLVSNWISDATNGRAVVGLLLQGDNDANTSANLFEHIEYIHKTGVGILLRSSDSCRFGMIFGYRLASGTGNGTQIAGGSISDDYPRKHYFEFVQPGAGGFVVTPGSVPPRDIFIACYSVGNGSPEPVVPALCQGISWTLETGGLRRYSGSTATIVTDQYHRPVSTGNIGHQVSTGVNTSNVPVNYTGILHGIKVGTSGIEAGSIGFETQVAGSAGVRVAIQDGLIVGAGPSIKGIYSAQVTINFGPVAADGGYVDATASVPGAAVGMPVALGPPSGGGYAYLIFTAFVSATGVVTVRCHNPFGTPIDPAAMFFSIIVFNL